MEGMEDCAMDHGKRAAESRSIGSEKRIKISEEQPDDDDHHEDAQVVSDDDDDDLEDAQVVSDDDDDDLACYSIKVPERLLVRRPLPICRDCNRPCDGGLLCSKSCLPIPPPTSEEVEKKLTYCHYCAKYADHSLNGFKCPVRYGFGGGSWKGILCFECGEYVHPGSSCFQADELDADESDDDESSDDDM